MPAVSGGLPRLSEVQAWDTQHLTTAAQRWADTATRWEGGAATAAQGRAVADRTQVSRVAERLRTVAANARSGAAELSAARQRVLSAVDATRAAGFEVLNDLTVTYLDDGTSAATAAARRVRAESLAQDLWRRAADLAAIDREVAQRITATSSEIHSL